MATHVQARNVIDRRTATLAGVDDYTPTTDGYTVNGSETTTQIDVRTDDIQDFINTRYAAGATGVSFGGKLAYVDRPIIFPTNVGTPGTTTFRPFLVERANFRASSAFAVPAAYEDKHANAVVSDFGYDWFVQNLPEAIWTYQGVPLNSYFHCKIHGGGAINAGNPHRFNISTADGGEGASTMAYGRDGLAVWGAPLIAWLEINNVDGVGLRCRRGNSSHVGSLVPGEWEYGGIHHYRGRLCLTGLVHETSDGGNADWIYDDLDVQYCRDIGAWFRHGATNVRLVHAGGCKGKPSAGLLAGSNIDYGNTDGSLMDPSLWGSGVVFGDVVSSEGDGTTGRMFGGPQIQVDNCRRGLVNLVAGTRVDSIYAQCFANDPGAGVTYHSEVGVDAKARMSIGYMDGNIQKGYGLQFWAQRSVLQESEFRLLAAATAGARILASHCRLKGYFFGDGVTAPLGVRLGEIGFPSGGMANSDIDIAGSSLTRLLQLVAPGSSPTGETIGANNRVRCYSIGSVGTIIDENGQTTNTNGNSFAELP